MNNVVTTAPDDWPITLTELKAQLNIDVAYNDDNTFLETIIKSATRWLEQRTGQSFIKQQRVQYMDRFPSCLKFCIHNGPVLLTGAGVSAPVIKYYDSQDVEQTWSSSNYWLDTNAFEPSVTAKYSWPSIGDRPSPISVTYFAGFGVDSSSVPDTIKSALKLIGAHLYNNRVPEIESVKDFARLEFGVERILAFDTRFMYAKQY